METFRKRSEDAKQVLILVRENFASFHRAGQSRKQRVAISLFSPPLASLCPSVLQKQLRTRLDKTLQNFLHSPDYHTIYYPTYRFPSLQSLSSPSLLFEHGPAVPFFDVDVDVGPCYRNRGNPESTFSLYLTYSSPKNRTRRRSSSVRTRKRERETRQSSFVLLLSPRSSFFLKEENEG